MIAFSHKIINQETPDFLDQNPLTWKVSQISRQQTSSNVPAQVNIQLQMPILLKTSTRILPLPASSIKFLSIGLPNIPYSTEPRGYPDFLPLRTLASFKLACLLFTTSTQRSELFRLSDSKSIDALDIVITLLLIIPRKINCTSIRSSSNIRFTWLPDLYDFQLRHQSIFSISSFSGLLSTSSIPPPRYSNSTTNILETHNLSRLYVINSALKTSSHIVPFSSILEPITTSLTICNQPQDGQAPASPRIDSNCPH
jgi:hypothetical protein